MGNMTCKCSHQPKGDLKKKKSNKTPKKSPFEKQGYTMSHPKYQSPLPDYETKPLKQLVNSNIEPQLDTQQQEIQEEYKVNAINQTESMITSMRDTGASNLNFRYQSIKDNNLRPSTFRNAQQSGRKSQKSKRSTIKENSEKSSIINNSGVATSDKFLSVKEELKKSTQDFLESQKKTSARNTFANQNVADDEPLHIEAKESIENVIIQSQDQARQLDNQMLALSQSNTSIETQIIQQVLRNPENKKLTSSEVEKLQNPELKEISPQILKMNSKQLSNREEAKRYTCLQHQVIHEQLSQENSNSTDTLAPCLSCIEQLGIKQDQVISQEQKQETSEDLNVEVGTQFLAKTENEERLSNDAMPSNNSNATPIKEVSTDKIKDITQFSDLNQTQILESIEQGNIESIIEDQEENKQQVLTVQLNHTNDIQQKKPLFVEEQYVVKVETFMQTNAEGNIQEKPFISMLQKEEQTNSDIFIQDEYQDKKIEEIDQELEPAMTQQVIKQVKSYQMQEQHQIIEEEEEDELEEQENQQIKINQSEKIQEEKAEFDLKNFQLIKELNLIEPQSKSLFQIENVDEQSFSKNRQSLVKMNSVLSDHSQASSKRISFQQQLANIEIPPSEYTEPQVHNVDSDDYDVEDNEYFEIERVKDDQSANSYNTQTKVQLLSNSDDESGESNSTYVQKINGRESAYVISDSGYSEDTFHRVEGNHDDDKSAQHSRDSFGSANRLERGETIVQVLSSRGSKTGSRKQRKLKSKLYNKSISNGQLMRGVSESMSKKSEAQQKINVLGSNDSESNLSSIQLKEQTSDFLNSSSNGSQNHQYLSQNYLSKISPTKRFTSQHQAQSQSNMPTMNNTEQEKLDQLVGVATDNGQIASFNLLDSVKSSDLANILEDSPLKQVQVDTQVDLQ